MKHRTGIIFALVVSFFILGCKPTLSVHDHTYSEKWSYNSAYHWHGATCEHSEEKKDQNKHILGDWTTRKEATTEKEGLKERTCKICGYVISEKIPKLSNSLAADRTETTYDETDGHKIETVYVNYKKVSETHTYYNGEDVDFSYKYQFNSSEKAEKYTRYNATGTVLLEYAASDGGYILVSHNSDGSVSSIYEYYDSSTVKAKKSTTYYSDGSYIIFEYDTNGKQTKKIDHSADGSYIVTEYDDEGYETKETHFNTDGSSYSYECNQFKKIRYTIYDTDGATILDYAAADGNYIIIYDNSEDGTIYIREYDSSNQGIKTTYYNADFTVNKVE